MPEVYTRVRSHESTDKSTAAHASGIVPGMVLHLPLKLLVNSWAWGMLTRDVLLRPLRPYLSGTDRKDVLEIGCGNGMTTRALSAWLPSASITAIDIDPSQIERAVAARSRGENVRFLMGDAQRLEFPVRSFDLVVEFDTFHHLDDWRTAVSEVARVLRPVGTFVTMEPSESFLKNPLVRLIDRPSSTFSGDDLDAELARHGIEPVYDHSSEWLIRRVYRKR